MIFKHVTEYAYHNLYLLLKLEYYWLNVVNEGVYCISHFTTCDLHIKRLPWAWVTKKYPC